MITCISCGRGFCDECCVSTSEESCCCANLRVDEKIARKRGRPLEDDIGESAGRKRAAEIYTIDITKPCEWRNKTNCGGGLFPITGCIKGFQANIHHGPVKDTSRNERRNAHLICPTCHNRWHAKNDPVYDEVKYELLPHNPRDATPEELVDA